MVWPLAPVLALPNLAARAGRYFVQGFEQILRLFWRADSVGGGTKGKARSVQRAQHAP